MHNSRWWFNDVYIEGEGGFQNEEVSGDGLTWILQQFFFNTEKGKSLPTETLRHRKENIF